MRTIGEAKGTSELPGSGIALTIIWVINDGGSPGSGNDSAYLVVAVPELCDTPFAPLPGSNVFKGNYTVHEG